MDNFEQTISKIINKKINTPIEYHNAIKTAFKSKKYIAKHSPAKILATTFIGITFISSIVFAGYITYEKIWKEPTKYYTYQEMINSLPSNNISEEEKENLITENEAKEIAINFLNNLGYNIDSIERIELKRNYEDEKSSYYMAKTEYNYEKGLMVLINSNDGKVTYFNNLDLKYKNITPDTISQKEATDIANSIFKKLGLEENYEIYNIKEEISSFNNNQKKIWGVQYYKNYDGILNKYESVSISFMIVNQSIIYDTININTNNEKITNPAIITKQEAIEIAIDKEKEFTDVEITNASAEPSIEKLNTFIYQLENEIYNTDPNLNGIYLDTENIQRNVWKVLIQHSNRNNENTYENYNQYIKENQDKYYYIDMTTGEIIGGTTYK